MRSVNCQNVLWSAKIQKYFFENYQVIFSTSSLKAVLVYLMADAYSLPEPC